MVQYLSDTEFQGGSRYVDLVFKGRSSLNIRLLVGIYLMRCMVLNIQFVIYQVFSIVLDISLEGGEYVLVGLVIINFVEFFNIGRKSSEFREELLFVEVVGFFWGFWYYLGFYFIAFILNFVRGGVELFIFFCFRVWLVGRQSWVGFLGEWFSIFCGRLGKRKAR